MSSFVRTQPVSLGLSCEKTAKPRANEELQPGPAPGSKHASRSRRDSEGNPLTNSADSWFRKSCVNGWMLVSYERQDEVFAKTDHDILNTHPAPFEWSHCVSLNEKMRVCIFGNRVDTFQWDFYQHATGRGTQWQAYYKNPEFVSLPLVGKRKGNRWLTVLVQIPRCAMTEIYGNTYQSRCVCSVILDWSYSQFPPLKLHLEEPHTRRKIHDRVHERRSPPPVPLPRNEGRRMTTKSLELFGMRRNIRR